MKVELKGFPIQEFAALQPKMLWFIRCGCYDETKR